VTESTLTPRPRTIPQRRKPRLFRLLVGLLALALLILLYPPFFQAALRTAARIEAWRHGGKLTIGGVSGSILEPIILHDIVLTGAPAGVLDARLEIANLRAFFSIRRLIFHRGAGWLRELWVDGVNLEVRVAKENGRREARFSRSPVMHAWLIPERIDARRVDVVFRHRDEFVRIERMRFTASESEQGAVTIRRIAIRQPWLRKTLHNVRGTVSVQDESVSVLNARIADGIDLDSASLDVRELASARLQVAFDLKAFGGAIRGEVKSGAAPGERLALDGTGSFSRIAIADLAAFAGSAEPAGGVIREGKFTFHGSPQNWEKATFSTRLEAVNFRWGERQWNSLAIGATMSNGRIQIPDLQLRQSHNSLSLNGELAMSPAGMAWWQSEFSFNIAAKIDDLSELSTLLGPRLGETAGKLTVDGSMRGVNSSFNGQLIVAGANLSYRTAPLDVLNAAIKLNGNEMQISHLEFSHGDDYLRGKGVVNILGPEKRYAGELRASIANLALYSAFLQPPVAPHAFAGALFLDWSGDGTARAHSGSFRARLKNVRPLESNTAETVPLDADMEGTYSPENIFFSRCAIGTGETRFTARLTANLSSLNLEGIRLENKTATWLEGDALLPFNAWAAWQNPRSPQAWNLDEPGRVRLTAKGLQLQTALLLTGRHWPVKGEINGNIEADGTARAPRFNGQLQLTKGQLSSEDSPINVPEAAATFSAQQITLERLAASGFWGEIKATGEILLQPLVNPGINLAVQAKGLFVEPGAGLQLRTDGTFAVSGTVAAPLVSGTSRLQNASLATALEWEKLGSPTLGAEPIRLRFEHPLDRCAFDIEVAGQPRVLLANTSGIANPALHLRGHGTSPVLSGMLGFSGMTASSSAAPLTIEEGLLSFAESRIASIYARGTMLTGDVKIEATILGDPPDTQIILRSTPPLEPGTLTRMFTGSHSREFSISLGTPP
jgi:hypothetical protein